MLEKLRNFVLGKRRGYSEIGTILELFQVCKNWAIWPAHTLRMAPITWACPVIVQSDPVTWAQVILKLAPITGPRLVIGRSGPIGFGPSIGF